MNPSAKKSQNMKDRPLSEIMENYDDLQKWLRRYDLKQINQSQVQTLQKVIKDQPYFTNQAFSVLYDVLGIMSKNIKLTNNKEQFLLQCVNLLVSLNQKIIAMNAPSMKTYKTISALFKVTQLLLNEIKDPEKILMDQKPSLPENIFKIVFRYLFIGLTKYQMQLFSQPIQMDNSSSSGGISSSSDIDGVDSAGQLKSLEKLRGQSMLLLNQLIRSFPKTTQASWQLLLKATSFSQNFVNITIKKQIDSNETMILENEFNEPSLLAALLMEPIKKIKLNAISALIILFDMLSVGKWITGHDFEKYEKQSSQTKQTFQPKAYQLFIASRNTHYMLLYCLKNQFAKKPDLQLLIMILKLYILVVSSTGILEKIPEEFGTQPLCERFLLPILRDVASDDSNPDSFSLSINVKICSLQLLGQIANQCPKTFESYLTQHQVHQKVLESIVEALRNPQITNENLYNLFIQEAFTFLSKLQKYHQHIIYGSLIFWDGFMALREILLSEHQIVCWFKVVEDTLKSLPSFTKLQDSILQNEYEEPTLIKTASQNQESAELDEFENHLYESQVPDFIKFLFEPKSPEYTQCALGILAVLPPKFWQGKGDLFELILDLLNQIVERMFIETDKLNASQIKVSFYRCIGILCTFNITDNEKFLKYFIKIKQNLDSSSHINIHVLEKMSWALANLCSNLHQVDNDPEVTTTTVQLLFTLSSSQKEKIATNGLRALGHFLHRVESQSQFTSTLVQCYTKQLLNKNPKISWNASFSLKNIVTGKNQTLVKEIVSNSELQSAINQLLKQKQNLKSLVHCYDFLNLMHDYLESTDWQESLFELSLSIIQDLEEIQTFLEKRHQNKLRTSLFRFLYKILLKTKSSRPLETFNKVLDPVVQQRLVREVYEMIEYHGRLCAKHQIIWAKSEASRNEILQTQFNDSEPIQWSKLQEESETASNQKYLKIERADENFKEVFRLSKVIGQRLLEIVNHSSDPVSFYFYQAIEELQIQECGDDVFLLKLPLV